MAAVLKEAGSGLDKVVKTTVFLKDMNDFVAMNDVYAKVSSKKEIFNAKCSTLYVSFYSFLTSINLLVVLSKSLVFPRMLLSRLNVLQLLNKLFFFSTCIQR